MDAEQEVVGRRDRLVNAAEEWFLANGYAATNMDDVARAAGMSKKTLYQLFPSKEALLEAVVDGFTAPIMNGPEAGISDGEAGLVELLEHSARHILSPRTIALFRLIAAEVKRAPELAEAFHRCGPGRGASMLERWIAAQAGRGWLFLDQSAEEAAGMLFGMTVGAPHMKTLLGQRQPPDAAEIARRVRCAVEIFLRGAVRANAVT